MVDRPIQPKERLARFAASLPGVTRGELFNVLQSYHELYYNELVNCPDKEDLARTQGKVRVIKEITETIDGCLIEVAKIDSRVAAGQINNKV